jgi:hypothetical protein
VAFDGNPLFDWAKAAGTVYQAELQRLLSLQLGVAWGPDRNGTREMVGVEREVLRAFSKRSVARRPGHVARPVVLDAGPGASRLRRIPR